MQKKIDKLNDSENIENKTSIINNNNIATEINKNDSSLRENHEELEYNNIEKYKRK